MRVIFCAFPLCAVAVHPTGTGANDDERTKILDLS